MTDQERADNTAQPLTELRYNTVRAQNADDFGCAVGYLSRQVDAMQPAIDQVRTALSELDATINLLEARDGN